MHTLWQVHPAHMEVYINAASCYTSSMKAERLMDIRPHQSCTNSCLVIGIVRIELRNRSGFFFLLCRFSAPDAPFSVPINLDHDALSQMLNQLLTEGDPSWEATEFDFLVEGELLRQTLQEHIRRQKLSIVRRRGRVGLVWCVGVTVVLLLAGKCHLYRVHLEDSSACA